MSVAINALKSIAGYLGYSTSDTPTSNADMQIYMTNQNAVLAAVIAEGGLWQPSTAYSAGSVIHSPNQKAGTVAVVTSTGEGVSGQDEPTWGAVGTSVTDGGVTYIITHTAYLIASDEEMLSGTDDAKVVTPAKVLKWFSSKIATAEQVNTGTDDGLIVTPAKSKSFMTSTNPITKIDITDATIKVSYYDGTSKDFTVDKIANATKADQDGDGNSISQSYLKKTDFDALGFSVVNGKLCVTYKKE